MPRTLIDKAIDLRAWMDDHGWSVRKLAARLDCASRTVQAYAAGEQPMPFVWALALDQIADESGDDWRLVDGELVPAETVTA